MLGNLASLRPCIRTANALVPGPLSHRYSLRRFSTLGQRQAHKSLSNTNSRYYYTRNRPVFLPLGSLYRPVAPTLRQNSTQAISTPPSPSPSKVPNDQSRFSQSLSAVFSKSPSNISSFRKIIALAKPERKPLLIAIGLLLVSSAVSMTIPFTVGKLIDFFSSPNPVRICEVSDLGY